MMKKWRKYLKWLIILLLVACGNEAHDTPKIYTGLLDEPLPIVQLKTLEQTSVEFATEPNDKPTVINIWATWCPPCIKELPSLRQLGKSGEVDVVTIAIDREILPVRQQMRELGIMAMPTYWDSLGKQVRGLWHTKQLPVTYLVDAEGNLRAVEAGERAWHHEQMIERIHKLTQVEEPEA